MADAASAIKVEICYATPDQAYLFTLEIAPGSTIQTALDGSSVRDVYAKIDLDACKTGVFGKLRPRDTVLRDGDRIELYRPLIADPKESRRRRAEKNSAEKEA